MEACVLSHRGSVPREKGARILISASSTAGTVGGGHLEWQVIQTARDLLKTGRIAPQVLDFALGASLGQCCGGHVTLQLQPLTEQTLATWRPTPPRFTLQLHGAGHVGQAIVKLLRPIPCEVQWVDTREDAFPMEQEPAHIKRVCTDTPEMEINHARAGTCFLVMTHRHDLDLQLSHTILRRNDMAWFGLIGSQTKRARFIQRLVAKGISVEALGRMICPIGLPELIGKEPEIIAISVVAQLLSLKLAKQGAENLSASQSVQ